MTFILRPLPPLDILKREFIYNPSTGILSRIARKRGRHGRLFPMDPPQPVGRADSWGYLRCDIPTVKNACVHRVCWFMGTGSDPGQEQIDHIDLNKTNNRLENLRLAGPHGNVWNTRGVQHRQGTPVLVPQKGVTIVRDRHGRPAYVIARISHKGRRIYLGSFPTVEAAHAAYAEAAIRLHGEFARYA